MDNFIFKPSSLFTAKNIEQETVDCFTVKGMEEFIDDNGRARIANENNNVFAKKTVRKNGTIKYSIKMGKNNKFFNPVSIYGKETDNTFLDRICRSNDRFKEVGHKVFELYLDFLNTKNLALLINAERENE